MIALRTLAAYAGALTLGLFAIALLMGVAANLYVADPALCAPSAPDCVEESAAYFQTFGTITMFAALATIGLTLAALVRDLVPRREVPA